jgi:hypothetical protein
MLDLMEKNNLLVLGNVNQFLVISSQHGLNYLSYSDDKHGHVHRHARKYAKFPHSSFIVIAVFDVCGGNEVTAEICHVLNGCLGELLND